jgi:hypothetical protein
MKSHLIEDVVADGAAALVDSPVGEKAEECSSPRHRGDPPLKAPPGGHRDRDRLLPGLSDGQRRLRNVLECFAFRRRSTGGKAVGTSSGLAELCMGFSLLHFLLTPPLFTS